MNITETALQKVLNTKAKENNFCFIFLPDKRLLRFPKEIKIKFIVTLVSSGLRLSIKDGDNNKLFQIIHITSVLVADEDPKLQTAFKIQIEDTKEEIVIKFTDVDFTSEEEELLEIEKELNKCLKENKHILVSDIGQELVILETIEWKEIKLEIQEEGIKIVIINNKNEEEFYFNQVTKIVSSKKIPSNFMFQNSNGEKMAFIFTNKDVNIGEDLI